VFRAFGSFKPVERFKNRSEASEFALPNVDDSTQQYDVWLTAEKSRLSFRPTNWRVWKGLKSLARTYWLFLWPSRRRRNRTQTRQDATIKSRRFNGSLASREINPQSHWLAARAWYTPKDLWCNSIDGHDQISRNGQHQRSCHLWSVDQPEVVCGARRIYAPVLACSFMIEIKYYAGYDPCVMQGNAVAGPEYGTRDVTAMQYKDMKHWLSK